MANFMIQAYYSYKGLFLWFNWFAYVSSVFLWPMMMVVMFTILGRFAGDPEAARDYMIGVAAYSIPLIITGGILQCFVYERSFGTLSFVFVSRSHRLTLYLSRMALHCPNGLLSVTASLLCAWLFLDLSFGRVDWATLAVSTLVIMASSAAFVAALGSLTIVFRDFLTIRAIAAGLLAALTGVVIPLGSLPTPLPQLGYALPLTQGLQAFRAAFESTPLGDVTTHLVGEAAVGVAYLVIGYAGFLLLEQAGRRRGSFQDLG